MSGRPFRRTALPCARGRTAHLVLVAALALTTFLLFCAGSPPGEASARRPHPVSAGPAQEPPVKEPPSRTPPVKEPPAREPPTKEPPTTKDPPRKNPASEST